MSPSSRAHIAHSPTDNYFVVSKPPRCRTSMLSTVASYPGVCGGTRLLSTAACIRLRNHCQPNAPNWIVGRLYGMTAQQPVLLAVA